MFPAVDHMARTVVLVVGDVMLDRYVDGGANRLSPEAPIPVLTPTSRRAVAGGAANVAIGLRALGCQVTLIGVVGADQSADDLATVLREHGVGFVPLVDQARPTTTKTRYVSGGQQLLRVDEESRLPIAAAIGEMLLDLAEQHMEDADALVISDYAKGVLSEPIIGELVGMAGEGFIPIVVDPKQRPISVYAGATVLTPNVRELFEGTGEADIDRAAQLALGKTGAPYLLVTRSEDGMTLYQRCAEPLHLPAHTQEVADVSGAGDTVVATVAAMLGSGSEIEEAMGLANLAAGLAVKKRGTASVSAAELRLALHEHRGGDKCVGAREATAIVRDWQSQGLRVGFTNGCFDLLHPGHVASLRMARERCDRLVVGLNSDQSIRGLKGDSRPVQPERARAEVLAGLASVDLVVGFEDPTPARLVERLSPDVLIKGADYSPGKIAGAEHVLERGGQVMTVPLEDGHSTSGIIARITARATGSPIVRR